jgi:hypothetical protein
MWIIVLILDRRRSERNQKEEGRIPRVLKNLIEHWLVTGRSSPLAKGKHALR